MGLGQITEIETGAGLATMGIVIIIVFIVMIKWGWFSRDTGTYLILGLSGLLTLGGVILIIAGLFIVPKAAKPYQCVDLKELNKNYIRKDTVQEQYNILKNDAATKIKVANEEVEAIKNKYNQCATAYSKISK